MNPSFSARTRLRSEVESRATFSPSSQISPALGRSRHPIRLTNVDLPDPEGPITAIHCPGSTEKEKSSSARITPPMAPACAGYTRLTFFSWITLFSPQNHSWLPPPQQCNRNQRREQRHRHATRKNHRQNAPPRGHGGMKVYSSNPGSSAHAQRVPEQCPGDPQQRCLGREESIHQEFR